MNVKNGIDSSSWLPTMPKMRSGKACSRTTWK